MRGHDAHDGVGLGLAGDHDELRRAARPVSPARSSRHAVGSLRDPVRLDPARDIGQIDHLGGALSAAIAARASSTRHALRLSRCLRIACSSGVIAFGLASDRRCATASRRFSQVGSASRSSEYDVSQSTPAPSCSDRRSSGVTAIERRVDRGFHQRVLRAPGRRCYRPRHRARWSRDRALHRLEVRAQRLVLGERRLEYQRLAIRGERRRATVSGIMCDWRTSRCPILVDRRLRRIEDLDRGHGIAASERLLGQARPPTSDRSWSRPNQLPPVPPPDGAVTTAIPTPTTPRRGSRRSAASVSSSAPGASRSSGVSPTSARRARARVRDSDANTAGGRATARLSRCDHRRIDLRLAARPG